MILNKQRIDLITLGCPKNTYDSGVLESMLSSNFSITHNPEEFTASICIINTCGFINDAKEQSLEIVFNAIEAKKRGIIKKLIVFGCLTQRYANEIQNDIPEIDYIAGVNDLQNLTQYLQTEIKNTTYFTSTKSTGHYAYLKIAEGCNWQCSFCAIPEIRGKYISRPINDIIKEAKYLTDNGAKEIILIAQDLTYYGFDTTGIRQLNILIKKLIEIPELKWLRLHYLYPYQFPLEILDTISTEPKICNYIDLPLQHISNNILKSMKRHVNSDDLYSLINTIQNKIPQAAIRTAFITGYPNETKKEFDELKQFIEKSRFERLGVFQYSHEEKTPAYKLNDVVSETEKQKRYDALMQLQQEIVFEQNRKKIGKKYIVIIDKIDKDMCYGRTEHDSPEIDGEVQIKQPLDKNISVGDFVSVKITGYIDYDLVGEVI